MKKYFTIFTNLFKKAEPKQDNVEVVPNVDFNVMNPTPKVVEQEKPSSDDQILSPLPAKKKTRKKKTDK